MVGVPRSIAKQRLILAFAVPGFIAGCFTLDWLFVHLGGVIARALGGLPSTAQIAITLTPAAFCLTGLVLSTAKTSAIKRLSTVMTSTGITLLFPLVYSTGETPKKSYGEKGERTVPLYQCYKIYIFSYFYNGLIM